MSEIIGAPIHCDFDPAVYFTPYLRGQCEALTAKDPDFGNIEYLSYNIMQFANRYPKKVIKEYLHGIYLLSDLRCDKLNMGGTCSDKNIYVTVYSYTSTQWLIQALHHEFSSVLWRHNKHVMSATEIGCISGYAGYEPDSLLKCLSHGLDCRKESDALLKEGFLNVYGKTNIENDFNIYSEYLFTNHSHLMELAERYPLVQKKVKLFKAFYSYFGIGF